MTHNPADRAFESFLEGFIPRQQELQTAVARAGWELATTGTAEARARLAERAQAHLTFMADPASFATVRDFHQRADISDPVLRRLARRLYLSLLGASMSPADIHELVARTTEITGDFNNFRAEFGGRQVSDNDLNRILEQETDSDVRRRAWEASKQIGTMVAPKVRTLARLRNRIAREKGFRDHFQLGLTLQELDEAWLLELFDALRRRTREAYARGKARLDARLARRFGVEPDAIMPWHYADPFFQSAPAAGREDLDPVFENRELLELARRYYQGVGLEVDDILARSDLYEREGKNQHAFCTDIDREGDVRILCNLRPTHRWMATLLHELGHGVYDRYLDRNLPYPLRTPAHASTTEAVAVLFGAQAGNARWLTVIAGVPEAEAHALAGPLRERESLNQLIFARWCMVVVRFEQSLYQDPEGDLDHRWWELVTELQGVPRPDGRRAPDWAAKIHVANYPVYYQSYLLGELQAAQLRAALRETTGVPDLVDRPQVGEFLVDRVFSHGARYPWTELVEVATGRPLSPVAYAAEFIDA